VNVRQVQACLVNDAHLQGNWLWIRQPIISSLIPRPTHNLSKERSNSRDPCSLTVGLHGDSWLTCLASAINPATALGGRWSHHSHIYAYYYCTLSSVLHSGYNALYTTVYYSIAYCILLLHTIQCTSQCVRCSVYYSILQYSLPYTTTAHYPVYYTVGMSCSVYYSIAYRILLLYTIQCTTQWGTMLCILQYSILLYCIGLYWPHITLILHKWPA